MKNDVISKVYFDFELKCKVIMKTKKGGERGLYRNNCRNDNFKIEIAIFLLR
jgi:hypothetical protein